LRDLHIHCIYPESEMNHLGASSKLNADWEFLQKLRQLGRKKAEEWLVTCYDKLGEESTCDIRGLFL
jgi:NTE family protein